MKLSYVRSDAVYKKIMEAPVEKKNDIYRYELMMPFKGKWDCYQIPMKAATPNGYDIIMASDMLGFISPTKVDQSQKANIESLSSDRLWVSCEQSIRKSLECFLNNGIELPVSEYLFTILLANAESPYDSQNSLIANYINPIIGDMKVQDITTRVVDKYIQTLQKTPAVNTRTHHAKTEFVTNATIEKIIKLLRCAFKQAVRWELVAKNPFDNVVLPKVEYKKRDIWTADMIRTALDQIGRAHV